MDRPISMFLMLLESQSDIQLTSLLIPNIFLHHVLVIQWFFWVTTFYIVMQSLNCTCFCSFIRLFSLILSIDVFSSDKLFSLFMFLYPIDIFPCSTKRSHVAHFETSIDEAFSWDKGLLVLLCFVHYCHGHFIHLGRGFVTLGYLKDLILH